MSCSSCGHARIYHSPVGKCTGIRGRMSGSIDCVCMGFTPPTIDEAFKYRSEQINELRKSAQKLVWALEKLHAAVCEDLRRLDDDIK